jgi:hypothetical protein
MVWIWLPAVALGLVGLLLRRAPPPRSQGGG